MFTSYWTRSPKSAGGNGCRNELSFVATFIMFFGGLLFKLCFVFGVLKWLDWVEIDILINLPGLIGSLCFLSGSAICTSSKSSIRSGGFNSTVLPGGVRLRVYWGQWAIPFLASMGFLDRVPF